MPSSLETLAPGFLIAAPSLKDPNFDHTVVLMCLHNDEGAMGLVINRPAPVTLADILQQMKMECKGEGSHTAMVGGPVALHSGLLLYETNPADGSRTDELRLTDALRLCPNQDLLREIGCGGGPQRYHIFLGHAGWGPGQLEQELAQGAWIPAALKMDLLFDTPVEQRWEEALRAEGLHPSQFGSFRPVN